MLCDRCGKEMEVVEGWESSKALRCKCGQYAYLAFDSGPLCVLKLSERVPGITREGVIKALAEEVGGG